MTVFEKITELFDSNKISYEVIEHEPVFTSADAAKVRDTSPSDGAKALVFVADKNPILVVLPGDKKVDTKIFKKIFNIKDLFMADKEKVCEVTTLEVGSIPPIGKVLGLKSYYDAVFKEKDVVVFNAGSHTKSIKMKAKDLITCEEPTFGGFAV